jgi:HEAT repeat protein
LSTTRHFVLMAAGLLVSACPAVPSSSCHATTPPAFEVVDSPMYKTPDLPVPGIENILPKGTLELWLRALERPEADLKCQAAQAIALAHRRGVKGMHATIGALSAALDRPDQHATARLAIARALVTLDARASAALLHRHAQAAGGSLRDIVEPALARWEYGPARDMWRKRLHGSESALRDLDLAISGLAAARDERAAEPLLALVVAPPTPASVRLHAAGALAILRDSGLEKVAQGLAADSSRDGLVSRLIAATLLRRHRGPDAVRILLRLADDQDAAISAAALTPLIDIDADLIVPKIERFVNHADANIRSLAVGVLGHSPTEKHIRLLGDHLDDADPGVRRQSRIVLRELAAEPARRPLVVAEAARVLESDRWRGLEQSTILLAQLNHAPASKRFLRLLDFDRPEVSVTAAWGLRKLAVAETLPEVAAHVDTQWKRILADGPGKAPQGTDFRLSQLNQLLGHARYAPADPILKSFIPKRPMYEARAAAVWALGLIHEGASLPALAADLEARLNDGGTIPPEDSRVRVMSALTLARLKAKETLPSLRKHFSDRAPSLNPVNNACGWAIEQITGEAMPAPRTILHVQRDWFLVPEE